MIWASNFFGKGYFSAIVDITNTISSMMTAQPSLLSRASAILHRAKVPSADAFCTTGKTTYFVTPMLQKRKTSENIDFCEDRKSTYLSLASEYRGIRYNRSKRREHDRRNFLPSCTPSLRLGLTQED